MKILDILPLEKILTSFWALLAIFILILGVSFFFLLKWELPPRCKRILDYSKYIIAGFGVLGMVLGNRTILYEREYNLDCYRLAPFFQYRLENALNPYAWSLGDDEEIVMWKNENEKCFWDALETRKSIDTTIIDFSVEGRPDRKNYRDWILDYISSFNTEIDKINLDYESYQKTRDGNLVFSFLYPVFFLISILIEFFELLNENKYIVSKRAKRSHKKED